MTLGPAYGGGGTGSGFQLFTRTADNQPAIFTGASRALAEGMRDTYFGSNPADLATLDANEFLLIQLVDESTDPDTVIYQNRQNGAWVDVNGIVTGPPGDDAAQLFFTSIADRDNFFSNTANLPLLMVDLPITVNTGNQTSTGFIWTGSSSPISYDASFWRVSSTGSAPGSLILGTDGAQISSANQGINFTTPGGTTQLIDGITYTSSGSGASTTLGISAAITLPITDVFASTLSDPFTLQADDFGLSLALIEGFDVRPAAAGTLRVEAFIGTTTSDPVILDFETTILVGDIGNDTPIVFPNHIFVRSPEQVLYRFSGVALLGGIQTTGPFTGITSPYFRLTSHIVSEPEIVLQNTNLFNMRGFPSNPVDFNINNASDVNKYSITYDQDGDSLTITSPIEIGSNALFFNFTSSRPDTSHGFSFQQTGSNGSQFNLTAGDRDPNTLVPGQFGDLYVSADNATPNFYINTNGATGWSTFLFNPGATYTQGSVPFANASGGLIQDNTNFNFNDTTNTLNVENLNVNNLLTSTDTINLNVADTYILTSSGYTTTSGRASGLVANYLPTGTTATVTAGAFVAGVPATSNPTVTTVEAASLALNDIIQISGSTGNDGVYEVLGHAANVLTIRGIGLTPTVETFTNNQFTANASDNATITKIGVGVIQIGVDGIPETAFGNETGLVFSNFLTATTGTLAAVLAAGNTTGGNDISISDTDAIVSTSTTEIIDLTSAATTDSALFIQSDSLTTGQIANFASNSADASARNLISIINDNVNASNATALSITQDSTGRAVLITTATANTSAFEIVADSLVTGEIVRLYSNAVSTNPRRLLEIVNDNALATGTTGIYIQQDSTGFALDAQGDVNIAGKLTVSGLIDPTGLVLTEQATVPGGTPSAGDGTIWVRNDTPNVLIFTDDAGTDFDIATAPATTVANTIATYTDTVGTLGNNAQIATSGGVNTQLRIGTTNANGTSSIIFEDNLLADTALIDYEHNLNRFLIQSARTIIIDCTGAAEDVILETSRTIRMLANAGLSQHVYTTERSGVSGASYQNFVANVTPVGNTVGNPGDKATIVSGNNSREFLHLGASADNTNWHPTLTGPTSATVDNRLMLWNGTSGGRAKNNAVFTYSQSGDDRSIDLNNDVASSGNSGYRWFTDGAQEVANIEFDYDNDTLFIRELIGDMTITSANTITYQQNGLLGSHSFESASNLSGFQRWDRTGTSGVSMNWNISSAAASGGTDGDVWIRRATVNTDFSLNINGTWTSLIGGGAGGFTQASIPFADGSGDLIEDNTNLFYTDTTNTATIANVKIDDNLTNISTDEFISKDSYLFLGSEYISGGARRGGLVIDHTPTTPTTTVSSGAFVAGIAATSNPTVTTVAASGFLATDIIHVTGSANNDGCYEVLSHAANLLTIKGIGTTDTVSGFAHRQFVANASDSCTITRMVVGVLEVAVNGIWQTALGSATNSLTFSDLLSTNNELSADAVLVGGGIADVEAAPHLLASDNFLTLTPTDNAETVTFRMRTFAETDLLTIALDDTTDEVSIQTNTSGSNLAYTTGGVDPFVISSSAATTNSVLQVSSTSASTGTRDVVLITNTNASAVNATCLALDQDANALTFMLESAASTADVIFIEADSLTTGALIHALSDSPSTATRNLVEIINDDPLATGTTGLFVQQDSTGFAANFEGDVRVNGKLTVTGEIDPTHLVLDEQATTPTTPTAGVGNIWVRADVPNTLMFEDDQGNELEVIGVNANPLHGFVTIDSPATTQIAATIIADDLTTGTALSVVSNSADNSARELAIINNQNVGASQTTCLHIIQNANDDGLVIDGPGITNDQGLYITCNALTTGEAFRVQGNSAAQNGVLARFSNFSTSVNSRAVSISSSSPNRALEVFADTTTEEAFYVRADDLTTGNIALFESNSADTGTRNLVDIVNDNVLATGATPLHIQQDANQRALFIESSATTIDTFEVINNSLNTGVLARFYSNSADTANRNLVEIHNDNAAAVGVTALVVTNDNTSNFAVQANGGLQITAQGAAAALNIIDVGDGGRDVFQIGANTTTTGLVMDLNASQLTTGSIIDATSSGASTATRNIINFVNSNASASGATVLNVQQDSTNTALSVTASTTSNDAVNFSADSLTNGSVLNVSSAATNSTARSVLAVINSNAGATGTIGLFIQQNSTGSALLANASSTTSNAFQINASSLTTGSIAQFLSDSPTTNDRNLVEIINDNALATGAVNLRLTNDNTLGPSLILDSNEADVWGRIEFHDESGTEGGNLVYLHDSNFLGLQNLLGETGITAVGDLSLSINGAGGTVIFNNNSSLETVPIMSLSRFSGSFAGNSDVFISNRTPVGNISTNGGQYHIRGEDIDSNFSIHAGPNSPNNATSWHKIAFDDVRTSTATESINVYDNYVRVDATAATRVLTLPDATSVPVGKEYKLKLVAIGGAFYGELGPFAGDNIDGLTTTRRLGTLRDILTVKKVSDLSWDIVEDMRFAKAEMSLVGSSFTQSIGTTPVVITAWTTNLASTNGIVSADQTNNNFSIDHIEDTTNGDRYTIAVNVSYEFPASNLLTLEVYVGGVATGIRAISKGLGSSNDQLTMSLVGDFVVTATGDVDIRGTADAAAQTAEWWMASVTLIAKV